MECFILQAQDTVKVDSLLSVLKNTSQDSVKIDLYIELGKSLTAKDTIRAADYFGMAIRLSKKIKDKKRICIARIRLAYFYLFNGKLPHAFASLDSAANQLKYFSVPSVDADFFKYRGIAHNFSGNYDRAVSDLLKASSLLEILQDSSGLAHCYLNLGISSMDLKNYDKALDYYRKTLDIYQKIGDEKRSGHVFGNMGIVYKYKKE